MCGRHGCRSVSLKEGVGKAQCVDTQRNVPLTKQNTTVDTYRHTTRSHPLTLSPSHPLTLSSLTLSLSHSLTLSLILSHSLSLSLSLSLTLSYSLTIAHIISAKIIPEMRGADFIVFRINLNGNDCNLMRFYFSNALTP